MTSDQMLTEMPAYPGMRTKPAKIMDLVLEQVDAMPKRRWDSGTGEKYDPYASVAQFELRDGVSGYSNHVTLTVVFNKFDISQTLDSRVINDLDVAVKFRPGEDELSCARKVVMYFEELTKLAPAIDELEIKQERHGPPMPGFERYVFPGGYLHVSQQKLLFRVENWDSSTVEEFTQFDEAFRACLAIKAAADEKNQEYLD